MRRGKRAYVDEIKPISARTRTQLFQIITKPRALAIELCQKQGYGNQVNVCQKATGV
jgi:hypothetical protein